MHLSSLRHVLHVEDEVLIALDVEAALLNAGVQAVTRVASSADALKTIQMNQPDVAILDIEVLDGSTAPVADLLRSKSIPFILYTGSGVEGAQASFRGAKFIEKPACDADLVGAVRALTLVTR